MLCLPGLAACLNAQSMDTSENFHIHRYCRLKEINNSDAKDEHSTGLQIADLALLEATPMQHAATHTINTRSISFVSKLTTF